MSAYGQFSEDYWELRHKATFDGEAKLIIVNPGETEIDVEVDIYSAWKEWALLRDYLKWVPALRTTGGDPLPGGDFLGASFFLINNWKILINESVNVTGNIFTDDAGGVFIVGEGLQLATSTVSNLIDKPTLDTGINNASIFV